MASVSTIGGTGGSPYPGLRPFRAEEAHIFYGREKCIRAMSRTLEETRFLAVLGPSGSGKSSLVRSGLFLDLVAGRARKAGERWSFLDIKHPRQQPYRELAKQLLLQERALERKAAGEAVGLDFMGAGRSAAILDDAEVEARRRELRRNPWSLAAWWEKHKRGGDERSLLLLVDQFEELFGYEQSKERDDIEAFVDLLLKSKQTNDSPIYIVLTMRSEFLGGCTLFPGLAEQINESLGLTPRMRRDECAMAITGPAEDSGVKLDPLLVTALLNDMHSLAPFTEGIGEPMSGPGGSVADAGDQVSAVLRQTDLIARRADQLPLMQHALNWMWQLARAKARPGEPIELRLDDYRDEKIGGLRGALSLHADQVMRDTGEPELTERIFRALSNQPNVSGGGSAESSAIRRPRTIEDLAEETGFEQDRVIAVVDAFRAEGVSMLTPPPIEPDETLTAKTEIDISHESLIRQWAALRGWIREEAESGRNWRELVRNVEQKERHQSELLRGLALSDRQHWWRERKPRPGWAERYGGKHGEVEKFLQRSVAAERRRKVLLFGGTVGTVALAAIALSVSSAAGVTAANAEAEAAASRAEAQRLRSEARRAQSLASYAASSREQAVREAELARQSRQRAEAAMARATAETRLALASVAAANRDLAAAQGERARIETEIAGRMATLYDVVRPQIRGITGFPFLDVADIHDRVGQYLGVLELSPQHHARGWMDYGVQNSRLYLMGLAPRESIHAGDVAWRSAEEADSITLPEQIAGLAQSERNVVVGDAHLLTGRFDQAAAAFAEAIRLAQPIQDFSDERAVVLADAWRGSALAHTGLAATSQPGRREQELASASAAIDSCLNGLDSSFMTPDARRVSAQCLIARAALTQDDAAAVASLEEAAAQIPMLDRADPATAGADATGQPAGREPPPVSMARIGLLAEYFRRSAALERRGLAAVESPNILDLWERISSNWSTPAEIGAFASMPREEEEAESYVRAAQYLLWPAEALAQADLLTQYVSSQLYLANPDDMRSIRIPDDIDSVRTYLGRTDTLLAILSRLSADNEPAIALRLVDLYARHNRLRILMVAAAAGSSFQAGDVLAASRSIAWSSRLLSYLTGRDLDERRALVRAQAAELFPNVDIDLVRYPGLELTRDTVEQLTSALCDSPEDRSSGCGPLFAAGNALLSRIGAQFDAIAQMRREAEAAAATAPRVWAGSDGVALSGYDPLTCTPLIQFVRSGGRPPRSVQDEAAPPPADSSTANILGGRRLRNCTLRRGFYRFPHPHDGLVWLFESEAHRRAFAADPDLYVPQVGGYDTHVMALRGEANEIAGETAAGAVGADGRLYLFGNRLRARIATTNVTRRALINWRNLPSQSAGSQPIPPTPDR